MELVLERGGVPTEPAAQLPNDTKACPAPHQGDLGTSTGVNIAPGSDDDGWRVPDPVRLADGTTLQLYKDGEALHAAFNAIKLARRRVCIESYIFADDDTGRAFADLLAHKARKGLDVYCIYDGFGSFASDRNMFRAMKASGVRVEEFHPIRPWEVRFGWRPFNRDHRKLLVVDDEIAGLGGLNVGGEYAGSWVIHNEAHECDLWRDTAVGIQGPGAKLFLRVFGRTWNYIHRGGRIRRAETVEGLNDGSELGVLASVPTMNSPLRSSFCRLMREARRSVYLTMAYFAPDDPLVDALCRAAKRGVRVRLMLPGRSDVRAMRIAAQSFYERLMACGVEVYERQTVVLHSKTMVVDAHTSVIGSTNLDARSIEFNLELSAIIRNDTFGRQMHDLFEHDVRYAKRINLGEWRRRPWRDRFGQWAVSRMRYLL